MEPIDTLMAVYESELREEMLRHPEMYRYTLAQLPEYLPRFRQGFLDGNLSIGSPTIRRTCKRLGIKHTYHAIKNFLRGASS